MQKRNIFSLDRKKFKIGIIFLFSSFVLGYGGFSFFIMLYIATNKLIWNWVTSILYIFSYVLIAIGLFLSGKEELNF